MKKFLSTVLALALVFSIAPMTVFANEIDQGVPAGTVKTPAIDWSRSTETRAGVKRLFTQQDWNWDNVSGLKLTIQEDDRVWDGASKPYYTTHMFNSAGLTRAEHPSATWQNWYDNGGGGAELRRIQGTFEIPEGFSALDEMTVQSSSLGLYNKWSFLNGGSILPINDNVYIFIYKEGETVNNVNMVDYLALWTGTINQNNQIKTFLGEPGTQGHRYLNEVHPNYIDKPLAKALAHTDTWYAHATNDNLGTKLFQNYPDAKAGDKFVIDVVVEDTSNFSFDDGGGMDKLQVKFTKTEAISTDVTIEYYTTTAEGDVQISPNLIGQAKSGTTLTSESAISVNNTPVQVKQNFPGYKFERMTPLAGINVNPNDSQANVLRLYYVVDTAAKYDYTVQYFKDGGSQPFATETKSVLQAQNKVAKSTLNAGITANQPIGYKLDKITPSLPATINKTNNVIKIYYVVDPDAKYSITYLPNGGTPTEPVVDQDLIKGQEATLRGIDTFTRTGYTFKGWNITADGKGQGYDFGQILKPTNDVKLYAVWEKNEADAYSYDVHFFADGAELGTPVTNQIWAGEAIVKQETIKAAVDARMPLGYRLATVPYQPALPTEGLAVKDKDRINVYYEPDPSQFLTIDYDANGGVGDSKHFGGLVFNKPVTILDSEASGFTRPGYTLKGWNTQADGQGSPYDLGEEVKELQQSLKLYAVWEENKADTLDYTVKFFVDGVEQTKQRAILPVWAGNTEITAETADFKALVEKNQPLGYKLQKYNPTLPTSITKDNNVIEVHYTLDESITLPYEVHYYKDNAMSEANRLGTSAGTVPTGNPYITEAIYNGFKDDFLPAGNSIIFHTPLPATVELNADKTPYIFKVVYAADATQVLPYTVEYYRDGNTRMDPPSKEPLTVMVADPMVHKVDTSNMPAGYKLDTINSTKLSFTVTQTDNIIRVYYVGDETVRMNYTVAHYRGEDTTPFATSNPMSAPWHNPIVNSVDNKATQAGLGYVMTAESLAQFPLTLQKDGQVIEVRYEKDPANFYHYTVEHVANGQAFVTTDSVEVLKDATVAWDAITDETAKAPGYKLDETVKDTFPVTINSDNYVITIPYVVDPDAVWNYTVEHYTEQGTFKTVPGEPVHMLAPTVPWNTITDESASAPKGYTRDETAAQDFTIVKDNTVIRIKYVKDDAQFITYTVEHIMEGANAPFQTEGPFEVLRTNATVTSVNNFSNETRTRNNNGTVLPVEVTDGNQVIVVRYDEVILTKDMDYTVEFYKPSTDEEEEKPFETLHKNGPVNSIATFTDDELKDALKKAEDGDVKYQVKEVDPAREVTLTEGKELVIKVYLEEAPDVIPEANLRVSHYYYTNNMIDYQNQNTTPEFPFGKISFEDLLLMNFNGIKYETPTEMTITVTYPEAKQPSFKAAGSSDSLILEALPDPDRDGPSETPAAGDETTDVPTDETEEAPEAEAPEPEPTPEPEAPAPEATPEPAAASMEAPPAQDEVVATPPAQDEVVATPPTEGGEVATPPTEGGEVTTPPTEGGEVTTPPTEGGEVVTPPTEGGEVTTPPTEGGEVVTPPTEGGEVTTPPVEGEEVVPPVEGAIPPVEGEEETLLDDRSGKVRTETFILRTGETFEYEEGNTYEISIDYHRTVEEPEDPDPPYVPNPDPGESSGPDLRPGYDDDGNKIPKDDDLINIFDETIPLAPLPNNLLTILDEDIPLGNLPKTGSSAARNAGSLGIIALALGAIMKKLKKQENEE